MIPAAFCCAQKRSPHTKLARQMLLNKYGKKDIVLRICSN